MNDLFLRRMQSRGDYLGEAIKNRSDLIMDSTFLSDPHTKPVKVYHPEKGISIDTVAKYQKSSKFSILKDQIDYHLQFRTSERYPIGCFVDLPNDCNDIETWLIVGKDDNPQFVKYSILKCNWTLKWIVGDIIFQSPGILRTRNSYNSGVWNDGFVTTVENQNSFWVPTNPTTQTIYYDTRFLISDNRIKPLSYYVTKIEDTFPVGITKIVMKQDLFDPHKDNAELMIANYYKNAITPGESVEETRNRYARIDISSWKESKIVIGSDNYSVLTGSICSDGKVLDEPGVWSHDIPDRLLTKFDVITDNKKFSIRCIRDYELVGMIITLKYSNSENSISSTQSIEVAAR